MKLFFCGGSSEVGASCILVELQGRRILLDCGMRMKGERMPDLSLIQQSGGVDDIILSHAHMDHTGVLPIVASEFPDAAIHCTPPTANLVRVLLGDSIKIMKFSQEEEIPLYDRKQVDRALMRIQRHPFSDPFVVDEKQEIQVTFFPAGHILGAASVYISSKGGSLFYSGDISADGQRSIPKAFIPQLNPSVCIFESTYGNRLHANRAVEEERFITQVAEVIQRGGKVLIPAFAVGRAQEVILILRKAMNTGQLVGCRVYVDGMVREVCRIYKESPNYLAESLAKSVWKGREPFFADNVIAVDSDEQRKSIVKDDQPCCIVASSGMLAGGASAFYAAHLASDEKSYITITGYQDEESPGSKLQNLFNSDAGAEERKLTLNGGSVAVKCGLGTFGLSAHADKTQLCGFIKQLNARRVFLVHGDGAALSSLQSALIDQGFRGRVTLPRNGSSFMIDCLPGRSFRVRQVPFSLQRKGLPDIAGLQLLSEKLLELPEKEQLSWSAVELCQMWGSEAHGSSELVMRLLNESEYFECDPRQLYLFRAIPKGAGAGNSAGFMEVNAMLAALKASFPAEVMYKCGARLESRVARVFFRFPDVAAVEYAEALDEFKKRSGWEVEINQNPDTSSFLPLLHQLAGAESSKIEKISWRCDNKSVSLALTAPFLSHPEIGAEFQKLTGYELLLPSDAREEPTPEPLPLIPAFAPKCSQQDALLEIDDVFGPEEVVIYKKSVKTQGDSKYIELQFLTPALGQRYTKWLQEISDLTGWPMTIADHPRQQELIMLARSVAMAHAISIVKGPSIRQSEGRVEISVADQHSEETLNAAKAQFRDSSGYELQVEWLR